MPKLLSIKEAANILEIAPATVANWDKQGILNSQKIGNRLAYDYNQVVFLKEKIDNQEIDRLISRANKKNSDRKFLPDEYFDSKEETPLFNEVVNFIIDNKLKIEESIFVVCLNKLIELNILENIELLELLKFYRKTASNNNINEELNKWQLKLNFNDDNESYNELLKFKLPSTGDVIGAIYQSIISEGHKSKEGSYYTPKHIAEEIARTYINQIKGNAKILDPCCGTGQFLLASAEIIKKHGRLIKPQNIWGYDIDPIAVQIARINLMVKFKDFDFHPNIYHRNVIYNYTYDDKSNKFKNFDLIISNPPWGAEFKIEQTTFLKEKFPEILSSESYSYFVLIAMNMLKMGGFLSFILPESILNIKVHKDIRAHILLNTQIKLIKEYGRLFKNVFTPVIRIDLQKTIKPYEKFPVELHDTNYMVSPLRFLKNQEKIFDIYLTDKDEIIINKVLSIQHTTLKNQADWALGIVTGNNAEHLSSARKKGYEEILKGTDIQKYRAKNASNFIHFAPKQFQQVAPTSKYRTSEKLLYRFISKNLIFSYDDQKHLTLNSANILIPKVPDYPIKVILALFNSSLYQFIFQKKFFTHKVLRSHLEQLPLPLLPIETLYSIEKLAHKIILSTINEEYFNERFAEMDRLIFDLFGITNEEQKIVLQNI